MALVVDLRVNERPIGRLVIRNDSTGTLAVGHYNGDLTLNGAIVGKGRVQDWRRAESPWELVAAALAACGVNHGVDLGIERMLRRLAIKMETPRRPPKVGSRAAKAAEKRAEADIRAGRVHRVSSAADAMKVLRRRPRDKKKR